jgi:hypothetical protein
LASIAGHSQIGISSRYVHPSEEAMFAAMSMLGAHKSGHSEEASLSSQSEQRRLTQ